MFKNITFSCRLAFPTYAHLLYAEDKNEDPLIPTLNLKPPELFTVPSTDGKVTLQGAVYKPDVAKFGKGPYPTVVSCYGGG